MIHTKTFVVENNRAEFFRANRIPASAPSAEGEICTPAESFISGTNFFSTAQPELYRPQPPSSDVVVAHEKGHQFLENLASPGLKSFETPYILGGSNLEFGALVADDASYRKITNEDGYQFPSKGGFNPQDFFFPQETWAFDSSSYQWTPDQNQDPTKTA